MTELKNLAASQLSKQATNIILELIEFKDYLIQKGEDSDAQLSGMKRRQNTEGAQAHIPLIQQHTTLLYPGQAAIVAAALPASRHLIALHLSLFVQLSFPKLLITTALTDRHSRIK